MAKTEGSQYVRKSKPVRFDEVLKLVNDGWQIAEALNKLHINRGRFYNRITEAQKKVLSSARKVRANTLDGSKFYELRAAFLPDFENDDND